MVTFVVDTEKGVRFAKENGAGFDLNPVAAQKPYP
jgi:hypothetical protein